MPRAVAFGGTTVQSSHTGPAPKPAGAPSRAPGEPFRPAGAPLPGWVGAGDRNVAGGTRVHRPSRPGPGQRGRKAHRGRKASGKRRLMFRDALSFRVIPGGQGAMPGGADINHQDPLAREKGAPAHFAEAGAFRLGGPVVRGWPGRACHQSCRACHQSCPRFAPACWDMSVRVVVTSLSALVTSGPGARGAATARPGLVPFPQSAPEPERVSPATEKPSP
jgi:hypothetical protein